MLRHFLGKSKRGLTNGGVSHKFSAKILPRKSGLFGPDWSLFRAYRGLFGADWDRFLHTSQPGKAAEIPPKGPFWAQMAPFGLSPRFAKPPFGFPQIFLKCLGPLVWPEKVPANFLQGGTELEQFYYFPSHLRPVIIKPVGRIFKISDLNSIRGKRGKCGRSPSPQKNKG